MDTENILRTEVSFKNLGMVNLVYTVPEERLNRAVSNVTLPYPAKAASFHLKRACELNNTGSNNMQKNVRTCRF